MTAEVAVLNRQAVVLAADSAVTIDDGEGEKVFTTVNKIFALSKHHPVGIMIYGNSDYCGIPWETLIKMFRRAQGSKSYATLKEYIENFKLFLVSDLVKSKVLNMSDLIPIEIEQKLTAIRDIFRSRVNYKILMDEKIGGMTARELWEHTLSHELDIAKSVELFEGVDKAFIQSLSRKYKEQIKSLAEKVFERWPLIPSDINKLTKIIIATLTSPRGVLEKFSSGVVFAGYGEDEFFPSVYSYQVGGILSSGNKVIPRVVNSEFAEVKERSSASIMAFAQMDVIYSFMEGADFRYNNHVISTVMQLSTEFGLKLVDIKSIKDIKKREEVYTIIHQMAVTATATVQESFSNERSEAFSMPILKVVAVLPKEELAAMAATLVDLTKFRRRITMGIETVAGPVDVAVISKGDGFIWIDRKHYFDIKNNRHFKELHGDE
jgi:hypothetical protein